MSQAWRPTSLTLGRQRQFKASQGYVETLFENKQTNKDKAKLAHNQVE